MEPYPRQTIVLAAGSGRRLVGRPDDPPKALVEVAGRSLLEHALLQAEAAGCDEALIVVGEAAERIRGELERLESPLRLRAVFNPDHDRPNGLSVLAAEPFSDDRFFLQMADHLFVEPVLESLVAGIGKGVSLDAVRLLVDPVAIHQDLDDATLVRRDGSRIVAIGKGLGDWDAIDAGCFLGDRRVFRALRDAAAEGPPTLSAGMRRLAEAGGLEAIELMGADGQGIDWVDVDTPEELRLAERVVSGDPMRIPG